MKIKSICYLISVFCFMFWSVQASKSYTYIVAFDNHTGSDYVISKRPRPIGGKGGVVYTVESADWTPILIVKAHEIGEKEALIRDPESFGTQIKLEPKDSKLGLPTVYLKGGIKMSGSCKEFWWHGPYAIDLATSEDVFADPIKNYEVIQRIRYCSYRKAEAVIHIYPDGIQIEEEHNMKVLDKHKVKIDAVNKGIKNESML